MRELSLHQLTAMEIEPVELVRIASELKCEHVCLFTQALPPEFNVSAEPSKGEPAYFPLVLRKDLKEIRRIMDDGGVSAYNMEGFLVTPDTDVNLYRQGLELGVELGARRATAVCLDADESRCAQTFARFCELCAEYDVEAGVEFCAFFEVKTLDQAVRVVRAAGQTNGSVAVDFLHLMRNGSTPANLAQLDPALIGYLQFCDGKLNLPKSEQWAEAIGNRLPPGEGEFPMKEFLATLPGRPLSLECPVNRMRDNGMAALARARVVIDAARKVLREHEPDGLAC